MTYSLKRFGAIFALFTSFILSAQFASALMIAQPVCPDTSLTIYRGARDVYSGGPVSRLQNYLISEGFLAYGNNTGFFGRGTELALRRYQQAYGIINYGSAYSTGYGVFGPATRRHVASRCNGGGGGGAICPAIQPIVPTCQFGEQAIAQYDSKGCLSSYRCPSWNTQNRAPIVTSFTGPTRLRSGETGTWSVVASDPESSSLSYSIQWGDAQNVLAAPQSQVYQQTTFTHAYYTYGTYTVRITVTDPQGMSATATATVVVDQGTTTGGSVQIIQPNSGTYYSGNLMNISWTDYGAVSGVQPTYNISLVNSGYTGCTIYSCSNPSYSYPIITGAYGTSYTWTVPSGVYAGAYRLQVCRVGSAECDLSDATLSVNQSGVSPTGFTINPVSGSAPHTVTASAYITIPSGTITACGTLTYGTIEWGDGTTDTMTYLGCSSATQLMSRSHTYNSVGTYTVRLVTSTGSVEGTQTVTVTTGNSSFTTLTISPSTVNRGETLTTNWTFPSTWSDARIRLELREANGNAVGESGIVSGLAAQSGSYNWVIPPANEPCVADAGRVCGANIVHGRSYIVRAIVYTPANACFGYCAPGYQPNILATRDSAAFTINGSSTPTGSTYLSVVNDGVPGGPYMVTATVQTLTAGTSCVANDMVLDYGNGQTQVIPVSNSGMVSCGTRTATYTYYYSAPGTYTIYLRSAAYPYTTSATQVITVN